MEKFLRTSLLIFVITNSELLYANSPEKAQSAAMQKYGLKLNVLCGINIVVEYDAVSLKKNNKDIGYGQTDGDGECDEPLRYMWYACQNAGGKAAIKKLGVSKVICKGVTGNAGKLSKSGSTIIVDRAFEESKHYARSFQQFKKIAGTAIKLSEEDPYHDSGWQKFGSQENPVTNTMSYCLVDGQKKSFEGYNTIYSSHEHQKRSGTFKCWNDGVQIMDLAIVAGKKTGYLSNIRDDYRSLETYKDNQRHGDQQTFDKGILTSHSSYQLGKEVWAKEYFKNNKLKSYNLYGSGETARIYFNENGKVDSIDCTPATKADAVLSKICGFGKPSTVRLYDSNGKIKNTFVFKDGLMESRKAGESDNGGKSDVKFVGGKKNGPEKYTGKNGKLASTTQWKDGLKNGPEKFFHTDGKKVIKLVIWKNDKIEETTDFYLNENPKTKETFLAAKKKKVQKFYDSGKLMNEGNLVSCPNRYGGGVRMGSFAPTARSQK